MATTADMEKMIEQLKEEARASWRGNIGEERAEKLEAYLRAKLKEYETALDIPQADLLNKWETIRGHSAINYYQKANQPTIAAENMHIFETKEDLIESIANMKFRCPSCDGVSSSPYECDSGEEMIKGKTCDWKVYGLFGYLNKGSKIFIKGAMAGETIFTPLDWEKGE